MAVRNKTSYSVQVASLAADNTTGDISPADLRSLLTDINDSSKKSNTTVSALGTNPTTWDVSNFEQAKATASYSASTILTLSNTSSDGRYIIDIDKNTASDVVLTIASSGLTVKNPGNASGLTLTGASGDDYKVIIERVGTNLYVSNGSFTFSNNIYIDNSATLTLVKQITDRNSNMNYLEYFFCEVAGNNTTARAITLASLSNSEVVHVKSTFTAMEDSSGNTGFSIVKQSTWKKNSSGTLSQIGADSTDHNVEDMTNTPNIVFSNSSGNLVVTMNSAGVGVTFIARFELYIASIT